MDFYQLARQRYSCRSLSDKKVPEELIEQIIDAGRAAPTAVNFQPYKIFRLNSAAARAALAQVTGFTFGANDFLVVGYREEDAWTREFDQMNFAPVDAAIVATHMMMEIQDLGLATTWVGYFDEPRLKALCPQMKDYKLIAVFPIGYAAEDAEPSPKHALRKSREEALEVL